MGNQQDNQERGDGREQRIVASIVIANSVSQLAIGSSAAMGFDPSIFIRRHRLRCELSADPIGFLSQDHTQTRSECSQRRSASAETSSDDHHISLQSTNSRCARVSFMCCSSRKRSRP